AVGYAVFGGTPTSSAASQLLTSPATVGNVSRSAVATGTVAVAQTFGLSFGSPAAYVTAGSSSSSSSSGSGGSGSSSFFVSAVSAKVGDPVTKGTVLASADTSTLQVTLDVATANLAAAKAKLQTDQGGATADVVASAQDSIA